MKRLFLIIFILSAFIQAKTFTGKLTDTYEAEGITYVILEINGKSKQFEGYNYIDFKKLKTYKGKKISIESKKEDWDIKAISYPTPKHHKQIIQNFQIVK